MLHSEFGAFSNCLLIGLLTNAFDEKWQASFFETAVTKFQSRNMLENQQNENKDDSRRTHVLCPLQWHCFRRQWSFTEWTVVGGQ